MDPRDLIGKHGSAEVTWPNGRVTVTSGVVIRVDESHNEVTLDSEWGCVVGDLDTLVMDDGPA